jgi:hypothetical protein
MLRLSGLWHWASLILGVNTRGVQDSRTGFFGSSGIWQGDLDVQCAWLLGHERSWGSRSHLGCPACLLALLVCALSFEFTAASADR